MRLQCQASWVVARPRPHARCLSGGWLAIVAMIFLLQSISACAVPVTYSISGQSSGSINGVPFNNASFSMRIVGDTAGVRLPFPQNSGSLTVDVAGFPTAQFPSQGNFACYDGAGFGVFCTVGVPFTNFMTLGPLSQTQIDAVGALDRSFLFPINVFFVPGSSSGSFPAANSSLGPIVFSAASAVVISAVVSSASPTAAAPMGLTGLISLALTMLLAGCLGSRGHEARRMMLRIMNIRSGERRAFRFVIRPCAVAIS